MLYIFSAKFVWIFYDFISQVSRLLESVRHFHLGNLTITILTLAQPQSHNSDITSRFLKMIGLTFGAKYLFCCSVWLTEQNPIAIFFHHLNYFSIEGTDKGRKWIVRFGMKIEQVKGNVWLDKLSPADIFFKWLHLSTSSLNKTKERRIK